MTLGSKETRTALVRILWGSIAALLLAGTASSCGSPSSPSGLSDVTAVTFRQLIRAPERYAGKTVRLTTSYHRADGIAVLTEGFAESWPPQPMRPSIAVDTKLRDRSCLDSRRGVKWSSDVLATGTFEMAAGNGSGDPDFGTFSLRDAVLRCRASE